MELELAGFQQRDRNRFGHRASGDVVLAQDGAVIPLDGQGNIFIGIIAEGQRVVLTEQVERDPRVGRSKLRCVKPEPVGVGDAGNIFGLFIRSLNLPGLAPHIIFFNLIDFVGVDQIHTLGLAQLDSPGSLVPVDLKPRQTGHGPDGEIGAAVVGDGIDPGAAAILKRLRLSVQGDGDAGVQVGGDGLERVGRRRPGGEAERSPQGQCQSRPAG